MNFIKRFWKEVSKSTAKNFRRLGWMKVTFDQENPRKTKACSNKENIGFWVTKERCNYTELF